MNQLLTRFSLLRAVLMAAAAAGFGCKPKGGPSAGAESGQPATLVLYTWADYCAPEVLERFEQQTGIKVDLQIFDDAEQVEARLRSDPGAVDVIVVDSFNLGKLIQLRLLHPLDQTALPNISHMNPQFLDLSVDPGNGYSVPYQWGTTLIAYRKDRIPEPRQSWQLLWDPAYRGHVMMLDDSFEPLAMTLISLGKKPDTTEAADYQQASQALLEHLESMQPRYGSDVEIRDSLVSGETWAAMCYSGDAAFAVEKDEQIDFFVPEEGATMWVDCLGIARDTRNAETAHRFLDFLMDPEVAALNANFIRYATPNNGALSKIDPALAADERIFPPRDVLERCSFVPQLDAEREALVNKYWYAVRAVISSRLEENADESNQDNESPGETPLDTR